MNKSVMLNRSRSRRLGNGLLTEQTDEDLLDLRFKDLAVAIDRTWLKGCLRDLNNEMKSHDIVARPHAWLSVEWFSPSNTPGVALPFYLAHPRLRKLERRMIGSVEGGTRQECMKILRHEAGHVVQHAYGLQRRRRWQQLFGASSTTYPEYYRPNPRSKNHVQHLGRWYAQCHPDEDFAETFAIWLTPRSGWRKRYADWPALEKLEYVDELMTEIAGEKPLLISRFEVDPIEKISATLGDHYRARLENDESVAPATLDRELQRIFDTEPRSAPTAAAFLQRHRVDLRRAAVRWTGEYPATVDNVLDDMIDRSRALNLRAAGSELQLRRKVRALLINKGVRALYGSSRRRWFAV